MAARDKKGGGQGPRAKTRKRAVAASSDEMVVIGKATQCMVTGADTFQQVPVASAAQGRQGGVARLISVGTAQQQHRPTPRHVEGIYGPVCSLNRS